MYVNRNVNVSANANALTLLGKREERRQVYIYGTRKRTNGEGKDAYTHERGNELNDTIKEWLTREKKRIYAEKGRKRREPNLRAWPPSPNYTFPPQGWPRHTTDGA